MKRLVSIVVVFLMSLVSAFADTKITVISDIHVMAPELVVSEGKAWKDFVSTSRTMLENSPQILSDQVQKLIKDKPDLVLIPGDLTKDGELASHQLMVSELDKLRATGIKVLVIPGNHDLGTENALIFDGDKTSDATTVSSEQFAELYQQYGYGSGSERDPKSLSYSCEPINGLVLIGIDTNRFGKLDSSTLSWVCDQAEKARSNGKQVLVMMHFLLFPHVSNAEKLPGDYVIKDYDKVCDKLIKAGVSVVVNGHFHIQEIAKHLDSDKKSSIYQIVTSSLTAYPCAYRQLTLNNDMTKLSVTTTYIGNKDFQEKAKERLLECSTKQFMKKEVNDETSANLAAKGFVIHAAGNENNSSESQTYLTLYEVTQIVLRLTGVLDKKLKEAGMTWDALNTTVRSMLTDTSYYGVTGRENRVDDLKVTIDMPKPVASGISVVEADEASDAIYTLQGVRVSAPPKGLYIQNGKLRVADSKK